MARRVFFSFHYENDNWRANIVRNSWVTKPDRESAGFWDSADWEKVKREGDESIRRWINKQLDGTSVTVVLIGAETSNRQWIKYEIKRSYERGNGVLGIYIHNIKNKFGLTSKKGDNHFGELYKKSNGESIYFWQEYLTYDWVEGSGYSNLGKWIEDAAQKANKTNNSPYTNYSNLLDALRKKT